LQIEGRERAHGRSRGRHTPGRPSPEDFRAEKRNIPHRFARGRTL